MTKVLLTESNLTNIGNAIRGKNGQATRYKPDEMAAAISAIPTGITPTGTKQITQNGTTDVTEYANAAVNVPNTYAAGDEGKVVSNGALVAQTARASEITQNGTYDTTENNSVTVNVSGGGGGGGSDVPSGYKRLEYIQSSGTQYINTGVSDTDGVLCQARCCFVTALTEFVTICGAQDATGSPNPAHGLIMAYRTSGHYACWLVTSGADTNISIDMSMAEIEVDTRNSAFSLSNGGNPYTASVSGARGTKPFYLFALNNNGSPGFYASAKIDYLFLYDHSGTAIRKFYAAQRESDSAVGLWDAVSETFFVNDGTGTFTAGPEKSNDTVPILTAAQWLALSGQQKRAYGLVAIQDANSGFDRGELVYGADYIGTILQSGTAASSASFSASVTGSYKLIVIALNSEASTYNLTLSVTLNNTALTGETLAYNQYYSSGSDRRNYRVNAYDIEVESGDTIAIELTNRSNYTSFVYMITDADITEIVQRRTSIDSACSGSYTDDAIVLQGIFQRSNGGTVSMLGYNAGGTVQTEYPGSSYATGYIFWCA